MLQAHGSEMAVRVRLNFQLSASENPLLVHNLLDVPKGKLRHARLTTLATIGLLAETRLAQGEVASAQSPGAVGPQHGAHRWLPDLPAALLLDIEEPDRG